MTYNPVMLATLSPLERDALTARHRPLACRVELHWPSRTVPDLRRITGPNREMIFCRRCAVLLMFGIRR